MHCSDCLRHVSFPARTPPSSSSSSVARAPRRRCPLQQIRSAFASACSVGMRCAASFRHSPAHSHAAAAQVFGVLLAFAAMQFTATLPLFPPPQALNQHNCARHRCPASTRRRLRVVRSPLRTRRALRTNRSARAHDARAVHGGRKRRAQICE